jgi:ABC-2 family transporter protein
MIWLTWRQFRTQALSAAAALAVFAILLAATGPHMASLYAASGLSGCRGGSCQNLAGSFEAQLQSTAIYPALYLIGVVSILLAPAVIGLFWGAPLIARELETGTSALAWNQSVTRTRWLAVKLTAVGLTAMAVTEGLSLMQAWWAAPLGRAVTRGAPAGALYQGRFTQLIFASHGITPLGYAAFAFALGVAAGALIRRTIPAMAVTLAVFAALQVAMPLWIRPHFAPADRAVVSVTPGNFAGGATGPGGSTLTLVATSLPGQFGAWILSSGPVDAAGKPVSTTPAACTAPTIENNLPDFDGCLTSQGIREAVTYQPASRYWPFQWTETVIYLALALALAGYCFRRLGRRLS